MYSFLLIAEEVIKEIADKGEKADWTEVWIPIIGALTAVVTLLWGIYIYWHAGLQKLKSQLSVIDEPRGLKLILTNIGRRRVFVKNARLFYMLGGQELDILMQKQTDPDQVRILEPHGDAETFRLLLNSQNVMQFRLGFRENPESLYIKIFSDGGEIHHIPNGQVINKVRSLLNEFDPEIP